MLQQNGLFHVCRRAAVSDESQEKSDKSQENNIATAHKNSILNHGNDDGDKPQNGQQQEFSDTSHTIKSRHCPLVQVNTPTDESPCVHTDNPEQYS